MKQLDMHAYIKLDYDIDAHICQNAFSVSTTILLCDNCDNIICASS